MSPVRIVIADDHPLMRAALKEAVTTQVQEATVIEAASVAEVLDAVSTSKEVDAILLDLKMPDAKGFSALVRLRAEFPDIPVVIVSATEDANAVDRALVLGASGYIVKSSPIETVGDDLRSVLGGDVVRPPVRSSAEAFQKAELEQFRKLRTLTPQQLNVLVMIAEGHSNKTVASRLEITESTVKAHITSILQKLGLQRRTQAAILAQRALQLQELFEPDDTSDDLS
jgi:DNA-binding NarL/FixJ family response regulator